MKCTQSGVEFCFGHLLKWTFSISCHFQVVLLLVPQLLIFASCLLPGAKEMIRIVVRSRNSLSSGLVIDSSSRENVGTEPSEVLMGDQILTHARALLPFYEAELPLLFSCSHVTWGRQQGRKKTPPVLVPHHTPLAL